MFGKKVLLVRLGTDLYALPIAEIEEVLPDLPIEAVPRCPDFVLGVVFVRGHLIPVVHARERLGLTPRPGADACNIVCLRIGARLIGVAFDEALDLMDLEPAEVLPASALGAPEGFFTGVVERAGRVIRLLDPAKLASAAEQEKWLQANS